MLKGAKRRADKLPTGGRLRANQRSVLSKVYLAAHIVLDGPVVGEAGCGEVLEG